MNKPEMMLWLSDARGVYIPRDFALSFKDRTKSVAGITDADWTILEDPDHEWYWDAWADAIDRAIVTDENGHKYFLHQEGDLWLVPQGMDWDEDNQSFEWLEESEA